MKKNNIKKKPDSWCDSTIDFKEFRKWGIKKQLKAIAEFAKAEYLFLKLLKRNHR